MLADVIRDDCVRICRDKGLSHVACCLSCADILAAIIPNLTEERFLLGKGHAALALNSALVHTGRAASSIIDDFPDYSPQEGDQEYMGSLGHALPIAVGMALAGQRVIVLIGDGEAQEGSVYEAMCFILEHHLPVTVVIDCNRWGAIGRIDYIDLPGYHHVVDGHDVEAMRTSIFRHPHVILAETVKGKGVAYMEDDNAYHYKVPT